MTSEELDRWVSEALREHETWARKALPSCEPQPRVSARFLDGKPISRRPFKSKGHWWIRNCGVARLVLPKRENGIIVFQMDYSRPKA